MTGDRWPLSVFGDEIAADLITQLEAMARCGVGHLELRAAWSVNVVDLSPEQLARVARLLERAGMSVSAIGSPAGKAVVDADFDTELGRLQAALDAAQRLQTSIVRVFSFFIPDGRYTQHRDEVMRRMSAFAEEARRRGLTLVHENESYIYGDTAERCLDLITTVGSPALRSAFDPANFVQVGVRPFPDAWELLGETVVHFHVKDAVAVDRTGLTEYPTPVDERLLMESVRLPGAGDCDWPALLRALDRVGYSGFLVIEPHLESCLPELDGAGRFAAAVAALRGLMAAAE